MKRHVIPFREVEHSGDLARYEADLKKSGFKIIGHGQDPEEEDDGNRVDPETGWVEIAAPEAEFAAVWEKFEQTDSFGFVN